MDFGLVRVDGGSADELVQEPLVGLSVVLRQQQLEAEHIGIEDGKAKVVLDLLRDVRKAGPVGHVFVHRPAFQGVEMRIQAEVVARQKPPLASATPMPGSREPRHPAPDTAPRDPEVER